ncbi:helix-hairpin-helix domain-containing protein [Telmatobacter bradus]|uniref:helix-hairpin-helix domain-containing protein n=1 Tax=Telmatobacter bradus TaxID=474953 RepID=UPI003B43AA34
MNPAKVDRAHLIQLTDLPNVGPSLAGNLRLLGYKTPHELVGADPVTLYEALCQRAGQRHDPCVLDVFLSITDFLAGNDPRSWWEYTKGRKSMQK